MNKLHLYGEVDDEMYIRAVRYLDRATPDLIQLNTEGGDFYTGLALYDLFLPLNTTILVSGACMSAGVLIFCAGKVRRATPSSQFMVHYGQDSNASSSEAEHNKRMLRLMQGIVAQNVNVTKRTVNSWFKTDTYFDAKRAKEIGLING